jgi:tetratricopeptide (TPR) repeat protein
MHSIIRPLRTLLLVSALICGNIFAVQGQHGEDEKIYALLRTGWAYSNTGIYDTARIYLKEALLLPGGKEFEGGRILVNLANFYTLDGLYSDALKYYIEGLEIAEKLEKTGKTKAYKLWGEINAVRAMANTSETYFLMGNQERALYYALWAKDKNYASGAGDTYICPQIFYHY